MPYIHRNDKEIEMDNSFNLENDAKLIFTLHKGGSIIVRRLEIFYLTKSETYRIVEHFGCNIVRTLETRFVKDIINLEARWGSEITTHEIELETLEDVANLRNGLISSSDQK